MSIGSTIGSASRWLREDVLEYSWQSLVDGVAAVPTTLRNWSNWAMGIEPEIVEQPVDVSQLKDAFKNSAANHTENALLAERFFDEQKEKLSTAWYQSTWGQVAITGAATGFALYCSRHRIKALWEARAFQNFLKKMTNEYGHNVAGALAAYITYHYSDSSIASAIAFISTNKKLFEAFASGATAIVGGINGTMEDWLRELEKHKDKKPLPGKGGNKKRDPRNIIIGLPTSGSNHRFAAASSKETTMDPETLLKKTVLYMKAYKDTYESDQTAAEVKERIKNGLTAYLNKNESPDLSTSSNSSYSLAMKNRRMF